MQQAQSQPQEAPRHTRSHSYASSHYSSSPTSDYVSDMDYESTECEYTTALPTYPLRVNRTVAITVEVSPRSIYDARESRPITSCYSTTPLVPAAATTVTAAAPKPKAPAPAQRSQAEQSTFPPHPSGYEDFELFAPPSPPPRVSVAAKRTAARP